MPGRTRHYSRRVLPAKGQPRSLRYGRGETTAVAEGVAAGRRGARARREEFAKFLRRRVDSRRLHSVSDRVWIVGSGGGDARGGAAAGSKAGSQQSRAAIDVSAFADVDLSVRLHVCLPRDGCSESGSIAAHLRNGFKRLLFQSSEKLGRRNVETRRVAVDTEGQALMDAVDKEYDETEENFRLKLAYSYHHEFDHDGDHDDPAAGVGGSAGNHDGVESQSTSGAGLDSTAANAAAEGSSSSGSMGGLFRANSIGSSKAPDADDQSQRSSAVYFRDETDLDFVLNFDSDLLVDKEYFVNLERQFYSQKYLFPKVFGLEHLRAQKQERRNHEEAIKQKLEEDKIAMKKKVEKEQEMKVVENAVRIRNARNEAMEQLARARKGGDGGKSGVVVPNRATTIMAVKTPGSTSGRGKQRRKFPASAADQSAATDKVLQEAAAEARRTYNGTIFSTYISSFHGIFGGASYVFDLRAYEKCVRASLNKGFLQRFVTRLDYLHARWVKKRLAMKKRVPLRLRHRVPPNAKPTLPWDSALMERCEHDAKVHLHAARNRTTGLSEARGI
eukprot:g3107.t1